MAESEHFYKLQIDVVVDTLISWYKNRSGAEKHVKRLGDKLVEENLIEISESKKIKDFTLVPLLEYIDKNLTRNLHAAETIMDWMGNNSQGRNAWENLRVKVLSFAIERLDERTDTKPIGFTVNSKFVEYGFEPSDQGTATLFEAISASLRPFECKSADEIKTTVKNTLETCDIPPCKWNGGPSKESWVGFRLQKWESGHPFVLHYLSEIYKIQIHVICLLTMNAVCFYPSKDVIECKRVYLGRVEWKKYVPLQPSQSKKKGRKGDHGGNQGKEYIHMTEEIQRLTSELNEARKENEQLQKQISELRNTIKQLEIKRANNTRLIYSPDQHSEMDYNSLKKENERLLETIEKEKSKLSEIEEKYDKQIKKENIQSNRISSLEKENEKQRKDLKAAEEKRINDLQKMKVACENKIQELNEEFKSIMDGKKSDLRSPTSTPVLPPIQKESAQVAIANDGKRKKKKPCVLKTLAKSTDAL